MKMRKTFRIGEYETEEGYHLFDVFDTEDNDNALETFMTEEQARDYVFDTYGREVVIL